MQTQRTHRGGANPNAALNHSGRPENGERGGKELNPFLGGWGRKKK